MSAASRLALAETRILPPRDSATKKFRKVADLARNSAKVPGALGFILEAPLQVCGLDWAPADAEPWGSPIGAALAVELVERG